MKGLLFILILTCAFASLQAQVNIINTIAGNDTPAYRGDDSLAINAEFNQPNQLCLDNFGHLYIADARNDRVRKIVLSTGIITTVAGIGYGGYNGDGQQATDAKLWIPDAVCTDTFGNIYIGDPINHRVRKVNIVTGIITTVVGNGTQGNSGDGNAATNAQIYTPTGLVIDRVGNLYLGDIDNHNVRKIDTGGIITLVAGNGTIGYSGDGGPATDAEFSDPGDIAVDTSGNIFICDAYENNVREVYVETGTVATIAGNGSGGYAGDNGPSTSSLVNYPYGICIDERNNIFFAERLNGTIRKIDGSTRIITTVVGCGIQGDSGDGGPATNAELRPDDVVMDKNGVLYIADYGNNRIKAVYNPKLSASQITSENQITIYPNPANDVLTIEKAEGCEMAIYDLLGQEVLTAKLVSDKASINITKLIPGSYIAKIATATGEIKNTRLIKE